MPRVLRTANFISQPEELLVSHLVVTVGSSDVRAYENPHMDPQGLSEAPKPYVVTALFGEPPCDCTKSRILRYHPYDWYSFAACTEAAGAARVRTRRIPKTKNFAANSHLATPLMSNKKLRKGKTERRKRVEYTDGNESNTPRVRQATGCPCLRGRQQTRFDHW